jgi:hypothetical protein
MSVLSAGGSRSASTGLVVGLASLSDQGDCHPASDGCGTDLCPEVRVLVGIAGEDDLDGPDLIAPTVPDSGPERPTISSKIAGLNGSRRAAETSSPRNRKAAATNINPVLDPQGSAALRDQFLADVDRMNSTEDAAIWAHRTMAAKNSL